MQTESKEKLEAKIVARPAFMVVGMTYRGDNKHQEIPELWSRFGPHMQEIRHLAQPVVAYGVIDNYDAITWEFDYMAAFEVTAVDEIPIGMSAKTIPAQTYAVFPCTLATIRETFRDIGASWLPESGYQHTSGPELEHYDERFVAGNPNSPMSIYIPIEPK